MPKRRVEEGGSRSQYGVGAHFDLAALLFRGGRRDRVKLTIQRTHFGTGNESVDFVG